MASFSKIQHGGRGRKQKGQERPERDLDRREVHDMPKRAADPDAIYKSERDGNLLFVYKLNRKDEARVVFRQNGGRPLQLVSYTKVPLGQTDKQRENKQIYKKM